MGAPGSASAWGKLGQAFHAAEFSREARLCYSNAAVLDANDYRWPYLFGLLELGDDAGTAIEHLSRAMELAGPRAEGPRFQLARALIERGQTDRAVSHLQALLTVNPGHAAAHVELARVYLAKNSLREATTELQPALTNSFTMRAALLLAAQIAQRNGQSDTAAQVSRQAASLPRPFDWPDPVLREVQSLRTDRGRLADRANAALQQQRTEEAEAALRMLLLTFPDDPEGLLLLGRLRFQQRRCSEAETALRRHLALQPNSLNGTIQLGLALMCQEKWTNAVEVLELAVKLKPDFAQAYNNLAVACSHSGDVPGAIRAWREALRCNPGDINAHIGLAEELANAGGVEEAKEHIRRAAGINPSDPRIRTAREQLGLAP
jgi:tetratricopeptide (TPR) repeat protein